MSWNTPDVYYQPEKFGLTKVAEIDYSDGNYQFDYRMVWQHEDGTLYTARDSGCSCPSPFEDYTSLEHLEVLDMASLEAELDSEVRTKTEQSSYSWDNGITIAEKNDFLRAIKEA